MGVPKDPEKYQAMREKQSQRAKERMQDPAYKERAAKGFFKKGNVPPSAGKPLSKEHKEKLAASHRGKPSWNKGIPVSEEERAHLSAIRLGKQDSEETKAKKSAAQKARHATNPVTEETRRKIGTKHKGKVVSVETRAKISAAEKGRVSNRKGAIIGDAQRQKMAEHGRRRWEEKSPEEKAAHVNLMLEAAKDITDSSIENVYATHLDMQGIVYERQKRIGWYCVDFYIEAENRIIEINGCYWHACEPCILKGMHTVKNHEQKRKKDEKRYAYLRRKGYTVDVVWEHDLPRKR